MKAKKIAAVVLGGALVATSAFALTACGGGNGKDLGTTELDISNYAQDYKEYQTKQNRNYDLANVSVKNLYSYKPSEEVNANIDNKPSYVAIFDKGTQGEHAYTLLNITTGKTILSNLKELPAFGTFSGTQIKYITVDVTVGTGVDQTVNTRYYAYDGTILIEVPQGEFVHVQEVSAYLDGKLTNGIGVSTSYTVGEGAEAEDKTVTNYFKKVVDAQTKEVSYEAVSKDNIKLYGENSAVDADKTGLKTKIYPSSESKPVEGDIVGYSYKQNAENDMTFYNASGEETGSVKYEQGGRIGFIGDNYYYYTLKPTEKDYNYVVNGVSKYVYTMYKYNVLDNTSVALDYNVAILASAKLYNYTAKAYDAACVTGYKMVDGVAYDNYDLTEEVYVVDKDLNVAYDLTDKAYLSQDSINSIYKLNENLYKIGNSIVDSDLNIVNKRGDSTIYVDSGLMLFDNNDMTIGFTDLSGKVVIAPDYNNYYGTPKFYNGVTDAFRIDISSEHGGYEVLLKKDGTYTKVEDLEKSSDKKVVKEVYVEDGFYIVTTKTYEDEEHNNLVSTKYEVFAFDGTSLKSFTETVGENKSYYVSGDTIIETVTTGTGADIEVTVTVYKIG